MNNKNTQQTSDDWKKIDPIVKERILQLSREKPILDEVVVKKDAYAVGYREGMELGKEEARKYIAINMIKKEASDDLIMKATNFPFEKIQQLRRQLTHK
ncbi:hypothetical protein P9B03_04485 [Metasolibacillus meyeri]|uniref:Transposase n=1 Tax=Metasolibacillus meyeri TaxID=1071052 RepID=A0AAW9NML6_9BACL|nr:hypothetical protein [Metasolibacillus meyeri]MEC1177732.1 hypothetical protein [Metasolibacillus meyeri]